MSSKSTAAVVGENLQSLLKIEELSDIDQLSADCLQDAISRLMAEDTDAYVVYSGLDGEQAFEARSSIAYYSEIRDKAWSRLEMWGSKLVAKDCASHVRERVLQKCCECANYVAMCTNSLSLFDIDWCVILDTSGFQLTSDDGDSFRRPDVCLASKVKLHGLRPLVVIDFFQNSPANRSADSAKHWLNNYCSIQYVLSIDVRIGESLQDELAADLSPPVVRHKVELELPQTCTTKISIWARPNASQLSICPKYTSHATAIQQCPLPEISSLDNSPAFRPVGDSECLNSDSFDTSNFDCVSVNGDSISDVRRCSTVLLPTVDHSPSKHHFCGGGGRMMRPDAALKSVGGFSGRPSGMKAAASCATLATVASESDYLRMSMVQQIGTAVLLGEIEGLTSLAYQFNSVGILQEVSGMTSYSTRNCLNGEGFEESFPTSAGKPHGLSGSSSATLQLPRSASQLHQMKHQNKFYRTVSAGDSQICLASNDSSTTLSNYPTAAANTFSPPASPWAPLKGSAAFQNAGGTRTDEFSKMVETDGEAMVIAISLGNATRSLQKLLNLCSADRDKAEVLRFVLNCRRLIEEGVLVGLKRDLKYQLRRSHPAMFCQEFMRMNFGADTVQGIEH